MAQIVLNFPDAQQDRIVDALCAIGGWSASSGMARGAFAKQYVVDQVKRAVHAYEREMVMQAAIDNAQMPPDVEVS